MNTRYILMNKNTPILECDINSRGFIQKINELYRVDALPVCVRYEKGAVNEDDLESWWSSRAIPASRIGLQKRWKVIDGLRII